MRSQFIRFGRARVCKLLLFLTRQACHYFKHSEILGLVTIEKSLELPILTMVLPDGVRIEIISNGSVLPMYDDPDAAEMDQTSTPQHYIEAVTGATFSVRVVLTPAFVKGPCDAVRVVVGFDGNQGNCMDLLKGGVSPPLREAHFSLFSLWDFAKGHWSGGTPSFARLDTSESQIACLACFTNLSTT